MKERGLSADITTAIVSVILSMVLILLSLFGALYFPFQSTTAPKNLSKVASEIGAEQVFREYPAVKTNFEKFGFQGEKAQKFLESEAFKEIFELYGKDMTSFLSGDTKQKTALTKEKVSEILVNHLDELVSIAAVGISDETQILAAESRIIKQIRDGSDDLIKSLPTVEKLCNTIKKSGYGDILATLAKPQVSKFIIVIFLVLCLVIYALRYYGFGGFLWLGTSFAIILVGCVLLTAMFATGFSEYLVSIVMNKQSIISAVAELALIKMIVVSVVMALLCAASFVAYGMCKKRFL